MSTDGLAPANALLGPPSSDGPLPDPGVSPDVERRDKRSKREKRAKKEKRRKKDREKEETEEGAPAHDGARRTSRPLVPELDLSPSRSPTGTALPQLRPDAPLKLSVHVRNMGPLVADLDVVHPFVRLWVVDAATGQSLVCDDGAAQCAMTYPYDLRLHRTTSPAWDDELVLDLEEPLTAAPHAMVLMELLDFGNVNIRGQVAPRPPTTVHPIAWGFASLTDGYGRSNIKRALRVQLFHAPARRSIIHRVAAVAWGLAWGTPQAQFRAGWGAHAGIDQRRVPDVFRLMADPALRQDTYPASVEVLCKLVDDFYAPRESPAAPYELTLMDHAVLATTARESAVAGGVAASRVESSSSAAKGSVSYDPLADDMRRTPDAERFRRAQLVVSDFGRRLGERCLPPTSLLHTVAVPDSLSCLAFSPSGRVLAVATMTEFTASVRLLDVFSPRAEAIGLLRGHTAHIHCCAFSPSGDALLTGSADKSVRVWNVSSYPCRVSSAADEDVLCTHTLVHPTYVYGAAFLGGSCVVTCGYDARLYLWAVRPGEAAALLCTTANFHDVCFRRIAVPAASAGGLSKVFTLDAAGYLATWRALAEDEAAPAEYTALVARRRMQLRGAEALHLQHTTAAVVCREGDAAHVVIVDTVGWAVLHRINIAFTVPRRPGAAVPPVCFLPDSRLLTVAASTTAAVTFDVTTGELVSSKQGTKLLKTTADVVHAAWSPTDHVAAFAVRAPAGLHVAVVGRVRRDGEEVVDGDHHAANALRGIYGGELKARKRRSTVSGQGVFPATPAFHKPRRASAGVSPILGPARIVPLPSPSSDAQTRIQQILGYWRTLVGRPGGPGAGSAPPSPGLSPRETARPATPPEIAV